MPKKIDRDKIRKILPRYIDTLPDREKQIVRMYYGLDGEEKLSYRQIGKILGISGERVRQIEYRAIERIWKQYSEDRETRGEFLEKVQEQKKDKVVTTETNGAVKILNYLARKIVKDIVVDDRDCYIHLSFDDGGSLSFPLDKKLVERIAIKRPERSNWIGGHTM